MNTPYDELSPVISPDGKTLFFTIGNHPNNIGGKRDPGDIWISRWMGSEWSAPVHAGDLLNDRGYNAVAGISADGTQLYLVSHYTSNAEPVRSQGISISRNSGSGWGQPENITIPYFQNKSNIVGGYITPDRSLYVFSAETYGSYGVEDIYVSFNEDGRWTEPKNLGSKINTQFQELYPYLAEDGKTLYFSTNGRKGSGSFDIYSSTRLDDTWTNWSEPENLGEGINTEGREFFYRQYPALGYATYTSTLNSDRYGNIKMFQPDQPFLKVDSSKVIAQKTDTISRIVEINYGEPDNASTKIVTVYGKVTNAKTGEPVTAHISFEGPTFNNAANTSVANGYSVKIPSTEEYRVKIEATGFVSTMEKLDIHTYEMKTLEMNFKLQPVERGTTVNLKSVLFERGTSNLLDESYPELDLVVDFLTKNPNVKIELAGHTDNRGIQAHNVRLSQLRVERVKDYLVSKGVAANRLSGKGYGGSKPIASNETEETRQLNRRVEFMIKKF